MATPFEKSPQLAAVSAMFLSLLFAILAQAYGGATTGMAFIFSILFPPGFYVFAIRCIAGFELNHIPTNALHRDPDNQLVLLHLIIAAIVSVFFLRTDSWRMHLIRILYTIDCDPFMAIPSRAAREVIV